LAYEEAHLTSSRGEVDLLVDHHLVAVGGHSEFDGLSLLLAIGSNFFDSCSFEKLLCHLHEHTLILFVNAGIRLDHVIVFGDNFVSVRNPAPCPFMRMVARHQIRPIYILCL
jgi:hypothetical protein